MFFNVYFVYNVSMQNLLVYIAYLTRYPLALIVILVAVILVWRYLKACCFVSRGQSQAAHGFF